MTIIISDSTETIECIFFQGYDEDLSFVIDNFENTGALFFQDLGDVVQIIGEFREKVIYGSVTKQIKVENLMKITDPNEELLNYRLTLIATEKRNKNSEIEQEEKQPTSNN